MVFFRQFIQKIIRLSIYFILFYFKTLQMMHMEK